MTSRITFQENPTLHRALLEEGGGVPPLAASRDDGSRFGYKQGQALLLTLLFFHHLKTGVIVGSWGQTVTLAANPCTAVPARPPTFALQGSRWVPLCITKEGAISPERSLSRFLPHHRVLEN